MHSKIVFNNTRTKSISLILASVLILSSCASSPNKPRAHLEDRQVYLDNTGLSSNDDLYGNQVEPFNEQRYLRERAEYFQQLAQNSTNQNQSIDATLSAAEYYVQADDTTQALQVSRQLNNVGLNQVQRSRYEIILAYVEYARFKFQNASNRLNYLLNHPDNQNDDVRRQRVDALLLLSFCYQSLANYDESIAVLIERESLLYGSERAETSRYIWQVIGGLSVIQRQDMMQNTQHIAVRNRLEQSLDGQVGRAAQLPKQFNLWREKLDFDTKTLIENEWASDSPRTIAVLLPITSKFNKAAQAVMDGIQYQHSLNTSIYKPRVDIYDIGDNPYQVSQYYSAARQNGAQIIIGPLGKDYANLLSDSGYRTRSLPTILLGGDKPLESGFSRLSMSPEQQSIFIADRALENGYINAALLVSDNTKGTRTAAAFSQYWLSHGGKISKSIKLPTKQFDHTTELKQLFD